MNHLFSQQAKRRTNKNLRAMWRNEDESTKSLATLGLREKNCSLCHRVFRRHWGLKEFLPAVLSRAFCYDPP